MTLNVKALVVYGIALGMTGLPACVDHEMSPPSWGELSTRDAFSGSWADGVQNRDIGAPQGVEFPDIEDDAGPREETVGSSEEPTSGAPTDLNLNFVGGPCDDTFECDFEGSQCQLSTDGFPAGHCSKPCDLFCPDRAGSATTFCAEPGALGLSSTTGWCVSRCDFGLSPTGCRDGYQCKASARQGEPETQVHVCVPGDGPPQISPCHQALADRGIGFEMAANPRDTVEGQPELVCHVVDPIKVDAVMHDVTYRAVSIEGAPSRIFASCPLALAMEETARLVSSHGVTDIIHLGVYNCRVISGTSKLSEHGLANAIDISGIYLGPEAHYDVYEDWEDGVTMPVTDSGAFLKWFVEQLHMEWIFNIILTPEYNAAHDDHFHCDLTEGSHSLH